MSNPKPSVSTATTYRILNDEELEGLQWRKDANELRLNTIFGNAAQKFPNAFIRDKAEKRKGEKK